MNYLYIKMKIGFTVYNGITKFITGITVKKKGYHVKKNCILSGKSIDLDVY